MVSGEGRGYLILRSLGLAVAGEDHSLLRTHHELGRLGRREEAGENTFGTSLKLM